jgi:hypothetical protein
LIAGGTLPWGTPGPSQAEDHLTGGEQHLSTAGEWQPRSRTGAATQAMQYESLESSPIKDDPGPGQKRRKQESQRLCVEPAEDLQINGDSPSLAAILKRDFEKRFHVGTQIGGTPRQRGDLAPESGLHLFERRQKVVSHAISKECR